MSARLQQIKDVLRYPACFIALGFGTGLLRVMPGTLSTVFIGLPLYRLLATLCIFYYSIIVLFLFSVGIFVCSVAEETLESSDDPIIVWDEICGYLVTMIGAPKGMAWSLLGLLLFRYFDIFKPWPIDKVDQRVKGGLGIMLDDVLAASYAQIILYCVGRIL